MNRRNFLRKAAAGVVAAVVATTALAAAEPAQRAWGVVPIAYYRGYWLAQTMHRLNEALALDYAVPFRHIDQKGNVT